MSVLTPIREAIDGFVFALAKKADAAGPNAPDSTPIILTRGDFKELIAALKQGEAELPTSLPFGL